MANILNLQETSKVEADRTYTGSEQLANLLKLFVKMFFMFALLAINFLALSISLNCNRNSTATVKFASAIFAFLFGIIYIVVNYYTYRVMTKKEVCQFDKDRLFPF